MRSRCALWGDDDVGMRDDGVEWRRNRQKKVKRGVTG